MNESNITDADVEQQMESWDGYDTFTITEIYLKETAALKTELEQVKAERNKIGMQMRSKFLGQIAVLKSENEQLRACPAPKVHSEQVGATTFYDQRCEQIHEQLNQRPSQICAECGHEQRLHNLPHAKCGFFDEQGYPTYCNCKKFKPSTSPPSTDEWQGKVMELCSKIRGTSTFTHQGMFCFPVEEAGQFLKQIESLCQQPPDKVEVTDEMVDLNYDYLLKAWQENNESPAFYRFLIRHFLSQRQVVLNDLLDADDHVTG